MTDRVGSATTTEIAAMHRALELAALGPFSPNPRVGCVLLADDGSVVAEGHHRGAGTAHAEADALNHAGDAARGTTAIVTLEPCNHTGRTGPCAQRLVEAGVRRVVFAQPDPNPIATGGAVTLREAGIEVVPGVLEDESRALNRVWSRALELQRPFVTWKFATTLDGRSAAADGTSRWVSSTAARRDTQLLRGQCDTMLVGTNTVAVDDPLLNVRDDVGHPLERQPLRAVMGLRDLPVASNVFDPDVANGVAGIQLRTHDPREALAMLWEQERRHVFLEGGPTLAAAFVRAGLVDEIVVYVAPMLLGSGRNAVGDLGIGTIADAMRMRVRDITVLERLPGDPLEAPNVRLTLEPGPESIEEKH
jgi:diaminohydroxyphosphoribosylaminopyrimidine deaminase / 5-amino-6-(5-phosphoribosylamino)uracil reductase